jgi:hypothetical protein
MPTRESNSGRRIARCWTRLTGTPVVVTMWQPQVYRRGTWHFSDRHAIRVSMTKQQVADVAEVVGAELSLGDREREVIRHALEVLNGLGLLMREAQ